MHPPRAQPQPWLPESYAPRQQHVQGLSTANHRKCFLTRLGFQDCVPAQVKLDGNRLPQEPVTFDNQSLKGAPGWRDAPQTSSFRHRVKHGNAEGCTEQRNTVYVSFQC